MSALGPGIAQSALSGKGGLLQTLTPAEALRHEMELLDSVATGSERFVLSLWSTHRCLVAPKSITRAPCFDQARESMTAQGWPVFLRSTGGDVTPQAPGVINVSTAFLMQPDQPNRIQEAYGRLCGPILAVLRRIGIAAYCAAVPGSFCDGDYNIVVAGKKLVGTAQRWRRMTASNGEERPFAVLAHASVLCEGDLSAMVNAVNDFYSASGVGGYVQQNKHTSLSELVPTTTFPKDRGDFLRSTAIDLENELRMRFAAY